MSLWRSQTLPLSAFVCSHMRTPLPPYTHTLTASLASSLGNGPPVVFALVWWGTVDVNTVNSLCSDASVWRRGDAEGRPSQDSLGKSSSLYLTVTVGEPDLGIGVTLGHRILVALGVPMPPALTWNQCYCI